MAVKPYLQLVRLPNLFTAAADSLAGWLLVGGSLGAGGQWIPLVLASVCVYAGGIVLNDVFDIEVDRVERPGRPLPSGKIGLRFAAGLGAVLLALGLGLTAFAGTRHGLIVGTALVVCVLAYDAGLKRTLLGPEAMGACRGLNVLLGMSAASTLGGPLGWLVAAAYAVFVMGVTWISRSEVDARFWKNIALGMALQNAAFLGLIVACVSADTFPDASVMEPWRTLGALLLMMVAVGVSRRAIEALRNPEPKTVQQAVKFGILALVWLHVCVLLSVRGPVDALLVSLLWFPAVWTGRWIYST